GVSLLSWSSESFAYADSYDETTSRYLGLRAGQRVSIVDGDTGLLVKPEMARRQMEADVTAAAPAPAGAAPSGPSAGPLFGVPDAGDIADGSGAAARATQG